MYFAGFLRIIAPGGGLLVRFFCPWGRGFALLCARWLGIRPLKKLSGGLPGGWSGLELTDALIMCSFFQSLIKYSFIPEAHK